MFKKALLLALLICCFSFVNISSAVEPLPLVRYVTDPNNALTDKERREIEQILIHYEDTLDIKIMIYIDVPESEYRTQQARFENTRTIFLIVDQSRRIISYSMNSSLSQYVTEDELAYIIDTSIGPKVGNNQLSEGLLVGIAAIQKELPEKPLPSLTPLPSPTIAPFVFDVKPTNPSAVDKVLSDTANIIRDNNIDLYIQFTTLSLFLISLFLQGFVSKFLSKETLNKKVFKVIFHPFLPIFLMMFFFLTGIVNKDERLQFGGFMIIFMTAALLLFTFFIKSGIRLGTSKSIWQGPLLGASIGLFLGYYVGDRSHDLIDWPLTLGGFGLMLDALFSYITHIDEYVDETQKKQTLV